MVDLLAHLRVSRVVAIVRAAQAGVAAEVAIALVDAGIDAVEIPLTTPDALAAIRVVRDRAGDRAIVGAGTVLTVADVRAVVAAGADFAVTPAVTHAVAEAALVGLPVLAGAYTPTEVAQAMAVGATAVKLFPATTGGVAHLKALRDPFPAVPFVPVGGVTAEVASAYLAAGAMAVGVGGPLVGDAARGGSLADLRERATAFVRLRELP